MPPPTKLPSKLPVRVGLLLEVWAPLVMTSRSEVDPKKAFNENGTLFAVNVHEPPALPPAAGIATLASRPSVRLVKLTPMVADTSVPIVLFWLVGEVAPASA